MTKGIPSIWRMRKQLYRLEGIHKVDQQAGVTLAHMRSSEEVIEQVKKNAAAAKELAEKENLQKQRDKISLEEIRTQLDNKV